MPLGSTGSEMPAWLGGIPVLGSGLGFRPPWRDSLIGRDAQASKVDFLEITADHYLDAPRWKLAELTALREHFTLIPHALDLSLGTAEGIDQGYLDKLAELVEYLDPPYWSEHLAFTKAGGRELGHLAPLPFSNEAVDVVARNVEMAKRVIAQPLILENITCDLTMPGSHLPETVFLGEVFAAADCGWLLDVTNLLINSRNHDRSIGAFLDEAPLERVVQLHYVGFARSSSGRLIDNHGARINDEVWDLMELILQRASPRGAILERDQNLPEFGEIMGEVEKTRQLGREAGRWN